mmetsp:Transcript_2593/g.3924  ORF Transcript_2593/g.3924 Transcript_2593/m.3924 type:complete len:208 (-) Transcript_2593:90-713(-)
MRRMVVHRAAARAVPRGHPPPSRGGAYDSGHSSTVSEPFHINTAEIVGITENHSTIYYKIKVRALSSVEWEVHHRYSSFHELHTKIEYFGTIVLETAFPQKKYTSWFESMTEEELQYRYDQLKAWLNEVVQVANGTIRPLGSTIKDLNRLKDAVGEFLEMKDNMLKAMSSNSNEHSRGDDYNDIPTSIAVPIVNIVPEESQNNESDD